MTESASLDGSATQLLSELDYNEIECFKEFGDSRFLQTLDCFERDGSGVLVNVQRITRGVLAELTKLLMQSTDDAEKFQQIGKTAQTWEKVVEFILTRYVHPLQLFLELKRVYYEQTCGVFVRRIEIQALHECYVKVVGVPSDYFK